MRSWKSIFSSALMLLMFSGASMAGVKDLYVAPMEAKGWCEYAEKYLVPGPRYSPVDCDRPNTLDRCIKLNNYACIKQPTKNQPWRGTDFVPGKNGAHDAANENKKNGHSHFVHPSWSILAKYIWFYRKVGRPDQERTVYELTSDYASWCDTLGSLSKRADARGKLWYPSCGVRKVPGRSYCEEQPNRIQSKNYCTACNCPGNLAETWVKGFEGGRYSIDDSVILFDDDGLPNAFMQHITTINSINETGGYRPNQDLLDQAGVLFRIWREEKRK